MNHKGGAPEDVKHYIRCYKYILSSYCLWEALVCTILLPDYCIYSLVLSVLLMVLCRYFTTILSWICLFCKIMDIKIVMVIFWLQLFFNLHS
jgi:hypothetical protein